MDYPISVPSVGLVGGKFVDENPVAGTPGSLIPSQWGNAVTDEILNVITGGGLVPNELSNNQLLLAIKNVILQLGVTPGRLIGIRVFTASGTYIPTSGTTSVVVEGSGAGAAGGGIPVLAAGQLSGAGGGASGAYGLKRLTAGFSGVAVTIGAGGVGVSGGAGGAGGATTFGAALTLPGGSGAAAGTIATTTYVTGAAGGGSTAPVGADVGFRGASGSIGASYGGSSGISGAGGSSRFGSGGGGGIINGINSAAAGNIAGGYGAGGGGALGCGGTGATQPGGNGAPGILIIFEYA